jgi:GNAT superfamily N-acetyltransferase
MMHNERRMVFVFRCGQVIRSNMTTNVSIIDAPAVRGLVFRPFDSQHDFPALVDLLNACNEADHADEVITLEVVQNFYAHAINFNPATDLLLAQVDDSLVGCGRVNWWVNDVGERLYSLNGCIHPAWRGKGIGRALLSWQEARAREIASAHPTTEPRYFQSFVMDVAPATLRLFERAGYTPIRYGFMMVRPNLDDIPDLPLPEGLEVRPVRGEDMRAIWEANDEAFRDHWGHRPGTEEDFQRVLNDPDLQPHLWQVAWDTRTNEVAGMVLNSIFEKENEQFHFKRGWTDPICVRRPWRRRGLARALIMRSLKVLREQGMTEAALGVDAENPNKALHLYESCGYKPVKKSYTMRKAMPVEAQP